MEEEKGIVCVTGGTGFLASWLIKRLLEHGYSVRATVRHDPEHKRDLSFLTNLPGASERLQIFHADLNDPDSFEPAIAGSTGVFHVATPQVFTEPGEIVAQRAIDATIGILKSCLKYKSTVKRVVYTSGASAVVFNDCKDAEMMDETYWSEEKALRELISGGMYSEMHYKTVTEKAAFKFAEEHGLDLVSIIPSFIVGPFICPNFPASNRFLLALILGNREEYGVFDNLLMVHVDDLAIAHIFVLEYPDATGRYICSSHAMTIQEIAEFFSAKYPEYPIPSVDSLAEIKAYKLPGLSSKKLLDTGFTYKYGVNEMLDEAIQCCKQRGYL